MIRTTLALVLALPLLMLSNAAQAQQLTPKTIQLPSGFQPEGIAKGPGARALVGTLNGGGVIDVDLRTGQTRFLVMPDANRMATGLLFSERANAVFVSGATTGMAFVFNADNGRQLSALRLANPSDGMTFINDVILTSNAAFFTDSMRPVIYRAELNTRGLPSGKIEEIKLGGPFKFMEGQFNANGIESVLDGTFLLTVNTTTGELFRIDPLSGEVILVDLQGGNLMNGDGIRLEGNRLLVVQNNTNQISVVELGNTFSTGTIVETITDPDFDIPTTVASFDGVLLVVNARFDDVAPGMATPNDQFTVSRVQR